MQEFLQSEMGFYVALCCLLGGLADLTLGWWLMGRHETLREKPWFDQFRRLLPKLFLFDFALLAIGLYGLHLHGVL